MAITRAAIQAPTGALTPELLLALKSLVPGATIADDVADSYAAVGNAKVAAWPAGAATDRGAAAWAQYRALSDRAQQQLTAAASLATDGTSRAYAARQAELLMQQAAAWLADYELEAAAVAGAGAGARRPLASRSVPVVFAW